MGQGALGNRKRVGQIAAEAFLRTTFGFPPGSTTTRSSIVETMPPELIATDRMWLRKAISRTGSAPITPVTVAGVVPASPVRNGPVISPWLTNKLFHMAILH